MPKCSSKAVADLVGARDPPSPSLPAATKLGQGNAFTGVCDSVNRGGGFCLSACWDTTPPGSWHPWKQAPPGRRPPGSRHPPRRRHPPEVGTPTPSKQVPPRSRYPPLPPGAGSPLEAGTPHKETPLEADTPPPAYGQWAAGTHPTGMHSCFLWISRSLR